MAFEVNSLPLSLTIIRLAPLGAEPVQFAGNPHARERRINDECQALSRAVVDDSHDAEAAPVGHLVGDEVELLPWDECGGNPKDFRDCQWVNDVATIPECDCACG